MSFIKKVKSFVEETRRYRSTIRQLSALSDRDLNDLGIRRCDIEFIAKKTSGVAR